MDILTYSFKQSLKKLPVVFKSITFILVFIL